MQFDSFVLPFTIGLAFLFCYLIALYSVWFYKLEREDKGKVVSGFFSFRLFRATWEIIQEGLLHRKMFNKNRLLGFMHMSLAFGWFLLIVIGNVEDNVYQQSGISPLYVPIFFRFFHPDPGVFPLHKVFSFTMDLLLLLVLSGVALAWGKRFFSKAYGMKRTTKLRPFDRLALMTLWVIFPLRLLAESLTSAAMGGGDFLTGSVGTLLGSFLPAEQLFYPAWWAYSLSLGLFFMALPFSRYMHIPTEIVLILSRHFGLTEKDKRSPFTSVEVNSCSRCGVCMDTCQLSFAGGIHHVQSPYQLKAIRYNHIQAADSFNCLMCGRCQNVCPVGIDITSVRQIARYELNGNAPDTSFFMQPMPRTQLAEVIYFAGCMTHQTPKIKKAMQSVLSQAGINYWFMDESGGICCGRPIKLAGHKKQADVLMEKNKKAIRESGARTLVTSCPICYKTFVQDYQLDIRVMHHSQYLLELAQQKKIRLSPLMTQAVYHDPCELSRDLKVYDEPRRLLSSVVTLMPSQNEKDDGLCCGGSLANLSVTSEQRIAITADAYRKINATHAPVMVTSCPMCKKVFERVADVPVKDIAEVVAEARVSDEPLPAAFTRRKKVGQHDLITT